MRYRSISLRGFTIWSVSFLLLFVWVLPALAQNDGQLIVADPAAEKLYVYELPALTLQAEFDSIRMAPQAGFLPLKGERLLFINEEAASHDEHGHQDESGHDDTHSEASTSGEMIMLKMNLRGEPAIIGRAVLNWTGGVSQIAVHPKMEFAAVASGTVYAEDSDHEDHGEHDEDAHDEDAHDDHDMDEHGHEDEHDEEEDGGHDEDAHGDHNDNGDYDDDGDHEDHDEGEHDEDAHGHEDDHDEDSAREGSVSVVDLRWWTSSSYSTIATNPIESEVPGIAIARSPDILLQRLGSKLPFAESAQAHDEAGEDENGDEHEEEHGDEEEHEGEHEDEHEGEHEHEDEGEHEGEHEHEGEDEGQHEEEHEDEGEHEHEHREEGIHEAFRLSRLIRNEEAFLSDVELGSRPQGDVISHKLKVYCSATDMGIECSDIDGGDLTPGTILPYDTAERSGGRALYVRLADDQRTVFSFIRDDSANPTDWTQWSNDAYIGNIETGAVTRVALGPGLLHRFALSKTVALYILQGPQGDRAFLLDADPQSPTFTQIKTTIALPALQEPLDPDLPPLAEGQHLRLPALTPDGHWGFVTHGGDSLISVINTAQAAIVQQLGVPTPLAGGGYVTAVQKKMNLSDTIGR